MSQSGSIGWYSVDSGLTPATIVKALQRVTPVEVLAWVQRSNGPDRSWSEVSGWGAIKVPWTVRIGNVVLFSGSSDIKEVARRLPPAEFVSLCGPRHWVSGSVRPGMLQELESAFGTIPEAIRGNFWGNDLHVKIGWHDLFHSHDELRFIARAWVSVFLWGHGTPANLPAFRSALYSHPVARRVRGELESELGVMTEFDMWDV